jgi:hypothetical protein
MYFKIYIFLKKGNLDGIVSAYFAESKLGFYIAFALRTLPAYFFTVDA